MSSAAIPKFAAFAREWLVNREPELRSKTVASHDWLLRSHPLPHFSRMALDAIGPQDVDGYKAAKLREGVLGPNQINKSIGLLATILDTAADYGYLDPARNPARGRRRRVRSTTPNRPTIDPEQLPSLLSAAGRHRPLLATMAGAGLRNGKACALDWADVDLAGGTLLVAAAKTDAGIRHVDLPAALGLQPISHTATPHSLRRLYASLRFALGDDPVYVAQQLGHTEPAFSMKVYARALRRRERLAGTTLREFDAALEWAAMAARDSEAFPLGK